MSPVSPSELVVKFHDALQARASGGNVVSLTGSDLTKVEIIQDRHGLTFMKRMGLSDTALAALEDNAAQQSGRAQPDLAGILRVTAPPENLETAARELLAIEETEWVEFVQLEPVVACIDSGPRRPISSAIASRWESPTTTDSQLE